MKKGPVGNTHLVAGGAERIPAILRMLEARGLRTKGNPDFYVKSYARFGVDDARELRERAALRAGVASLSSRRPT